MAELHTGRALLTHGRWSLAQQRASRTTAQLALTQARGTLARSLPSLTTSRRSFPLAFVSFTIERSTSLGAQSTFWGVLLVVEGSRFTTAAALTITAELPTMAMAAITLAMSTASTTRSCAAHRCYFSTGKLYQLGAPPPFAQRCRLALFLSFSAPVGGRTFARELTSAGPINGVPALYKG